MKRRGSNVEREFSGSGRRNPEEWEEVPFGHMHGDEEDEKFDGEDEEEIEEDEDEEDEDKDEEDEDDDLEEEEDEDF